MAVTIESVSTQAWAGIANSDNLNITKPTGTADGDLLVAHIASSLDAVDNHVVSTPAGWTLLFEQEVGASANSGCMTIFYKVASSEGASYNFTNASGRMLLMAGAIYRISSAVSAGIQYAVDADETADATPVFTNTVTPSAANSLLLFLTNAVGTEGGSTSASGYEIITSNPAWTEQYDIAGDGDATFGGGSDGDGFMAGASALRPETSATGNSTVTFSAAWAKSIGAIIVIPPIVNAIVNPAVVTMTLSCPAPVITGSASVSPGVVIITLSVQSPSVTVPTPEWSNEDKSSASYVN